VVTEELSFGREISHLLRAGLRGEG
jgi:hypothetical protein